MTDDNRKPGRPTFTGETARPRSIRVDDTTWREWKRKAKRSKLSVSEWLRQLADKA